jgi:hypothetical protein
MILRTIAHILHRQASLSTDMGQLSTVLEITDFACLDNTPQIWAGIKG